MATYQGHKNWNHWNVSIWINNDEGLYRAALDHVRNCSGTREQAARNFLGDLAQTGHTHTPDGAPYSVSAIRAAMVGM